MFLIERGCKGRTGRNDSNKSLATEIYIILSFVREYVLFVFRKRSLRVIRPHIVLYFILVLILYFILALTPCIVIGVTKR